MDLRRGRPGLGVRIGLGLILLVASGFETVGAQSNDICNFYDHPAPAFPNIELCAFAGAYRDSSLIEPKRCLGLHHGPLPDSVEARARTITVRFRRDRRVEARKDFGGYRIYRVVNFTGPADSSKMILIRRFSRQVGDERTWNFSVVDTSTLLFKCKGAVVNDSVVTFVDPDSSGSYQKVCRLRNPPDDINGRCMSPTDSIFVLRAPPGPHDGFRTWYSITYEGKNNSADGSYSDLFVPDHSNCAVPSDSTTCANLNHKLLNLTPYAVEPTGGPTANLERVRVVPNPFRASVPWDAPGGQEVHFTNLPHSSRIKIYTVSGDLVAELNHSDTVRDFERWNLKNQNGRDVASGIYMFRVEASSFSFQDRFIVIR